MCSKLTRALRLPNKPLERAGTSAHVDVGAARAGRSAPRR